MCVAKFQVLESSVCHGGGIIKKINKIKKSESSSNIPVFGYKTKSPLFFDHSQRKHLILPC